LRPFADDHPLLEAITRGDFLINGFRNRDLQAILYPEPADSPKEKRRRSAAISRKLRMLRAHKLIHKKGNTRAYQVAPEARAILVASRTSLHQINKLQKAAA
jgi:hypothetical protein